MSKTTRTVIYILLVLTIFLSLLSKERRERHNPPPAGAVTRPQ